MSILPTLLFLLFPQQVRYEVDGQVLEILGVGQMRAGVFEIWSPTGAPDESLTRMVNTTMSRTRHNSVTTVPGRKNRVLVFRERGTDPSHPNFLFNSVMDVMEFGDRVRLQSRSVKEGADTRREEVTLYAFATEPDAKTVTPSLTVWDWVKPSPIVMTAKVGETCKVRNAEIRLASVKRDKDSRDRTRWLYCFEVQRHDDLSASLYPVVADGGTVAQTNQEGRPIRTFRFDDFNPIPDRSGHVKGPVGMTGKNLFDHRFSLSESREVTCSWPLDPQFVSGFSFTAEWKRIVTLPEIVLDPAPRGSSKREEF